MADEPRQPDEPGPSDEAGASSPDEPSVPSDGDAAPDARQPPSPVLAPGNPLRLRALLPLCIGAALALGTMTTEASPRVVVAASVLGLAIAVWGVLDLLGSFDDGDSRVA